MTKVVLAISADEADFNFLMEISKKYHSKNLSQAFHTLIYEHIETIKYAAKLKQMLQNTPSVPPMTPRTSGKKPVNPMVNP